jgi:hypothetical protein
MNRKSNFSDFSTLKKYNNSNLHIPSGPKRDYQLVPEFRGFNYLNPNYNSLNTSGGFTEYADINASYLDKNCVKYIERKCNHQNPTPTPKVSR